MSEHAPITININLGLEAARDGSGRLRPFGVTDVLSDAYEDAKSVYEAVRLGPQPCPPFMLRMKDPNGNLYEANQTKNDPVFSVLRSECASRLGDMGHVTGKAAAYQEDALTYWGTVCVVTGVEDTGNPHQVDSSDKVACVLVALVSEYIRTKPQ